MSRPRREWPFTLGLAVAAAGSAGLVIAMLSADVLETSPGHVTAAFEQPAVRAALRLSVLTSALSTLLAVWVAVPTGYLLARVPFPGRGLVELVTDLPLVLPPTVVGLSLLLLSQTEFGRRVSFGAAVAYDVPAVVVAQFVVTAAFATQGARLVFARQSTRPEELARTLGCTRGEAFWRVVLPDARPDLCAVAALAWARSLGEFGPVLVFAGAARFKTEVLPTTVYLELGAGNLEGAVAASLLLGVVSVVVLATVRFTTGGRR